MAVPKRTCASESSVKKNKAKFKQRKCQRCSTSDKIKNEGKNVG